MIRDDVYVVVLWTFIKNEAFIAFGQVRHAISIQNECRCVLNIYGYLRAFQNDFPIDSENLFYCIVSKIVFWIEPMIISFNNILFISEKWHFIFG